MRVTSFRHKGLERFWRDDDPRGLPPQPVEKIRAMLTALSEAEKIAEVELFSGWRLHQLKGNRRGTWSMTVTRNYRLTFRLERTNVLELDLEDYHGN